MYLKVSFIDPNHSVNVTTIDSPVTNDGRFLVFTSDFATKGLGTQTCTQPAASCIQPSLIIISIEHAPAKFRLVFQINVLADR